MKKIWKENSDFFLRLVCLALVAGMLCAYQSRAKAWAELKEENRQAVEEAEAYNAHILAEQRAQEEEEGQGAYLDGTYTGTGTGFGGEITVEVTVENGTITGIEILSASGEDSSYLAIAQDIVGEIISAQSAQVDTVTGATFSSGGIREATENALSQAVNPNAAN